MLQEVVALLRKTPTGRSILEGAKAAKVEQLSLDEARALELEAERDTIRALPPTHRRAQAERLNELRTAAVVSGKEGWAAVRQAEALVAQKQQELAQAREAASAAHAERAGEDTRRAREIQTLERELEIGMPEAIEQFVAYVRERWESVAGLRQMDWSEAGEVEEETSGWFSTGWFRKDKKFTSKHARQRALGDLQVALVEAKALGLSGEGEAVISAQLATLRARAAEAIASVGGEEVAA